MLSELSNFVHQIYTYILNKFQWYQPTGIAYSVESENPSLFHKITEVGSYLWRLILSLLNAFGHVPFIGNDDGNNRTVMDKALIELEPHHDLEFWRMMLLGASLSFAGLIFWLLYDHEDQDIRKEENEYPTILFQDWANYEDTVNQANHYGQRGDVQEGTDFDHCLETRSSLSDTSVVSIPNTGAIAKRFKSLE